MTITITTTLVSMLFISCSSLSVKSTTILIEDYDDTPMMNWYVKNDPVMGGESKSTLKIEDGMGKFSGVVVDVPFLSAPGFITMESRGGPYPDVSSCRGISFEARSNTEYSGYRFSFGMVQAEGMRYMRGFKTSFTVGKDFETVRLPFDEFSDNWDGRTGDIRVHCAEDHSYCPTRNVLQNMGVMQFWGEGVNGLVDLEVKSVSAYDCRESPLEQVENVAAVPLSAVAMVTSLLSLFYVWKMRMKERKVVLQIESEKDVDSNELL